MTQATPPPHTNTRVRAHTHAHTYHGDSKNGKYGAKFSATEFMELPARHTMMPPATGQLPLTQRAGFHPKPAHVGFVADEVAVRDDFSPGISVFPHQYHSINDTHTHTHIHTCFTTTI
jgi:hypothetical protein